MKREGDGPGDVPAPRLALQWPTVVCCHVANIDDGEAGVTQLLRQFRGRDRLGHKPLGLLCMGSEFCALLPSIEFCGGTACPRKFTTDSVVYAAGGYLLVGFIPAKVWGPEHPDIRAYRIIRFRW